MVKGLSYSVTRLQNIKFTHHDHRYWNDKYDNIPSVTTILTSGHAVVQNKAMLLGTYIHNLLALYFTTEDQDLRHKVIKSIKENPTAFNMMNSIILLMKTGYVPLQIETMYGAEIEVEGVKYPYAGRADMVFKKNNILMVEDHKSGNEYEYYPLQLGGNALLIGSKCVEGCNIYKNCIKWIDIDKSKEEFVKRLVAYHQGKNKNDLNTEFINDESLLDIANYYITVSESYTRSKKLKDSLKDYLIKKIDDNGMKKKLDRLNISYNTTEKPLNVKKHVIDRMYNLISNSNKYDVNDFFDVSIKPNENLYSKWLLTHPEFFEKQEKVESKYKFTVSKEGKK